MRLPSIQPIFQGIPPRVLDTRLQWNCSIVWSNLIFLFLTLHKAGDLEHSIKEAENSSLDAKHERNYLQTQYKKLEGEKIELEQQLSAISRERNALETRLAELEDRNR